MVKPCPFNPDGWSVFDGNELVELINQNYFIERSAAERLATALRYARMMDTIKEISRKKSPLMELLCP